jgi:hypothetical protein
MYFKDHTRELAKSTTMEAATLFWDGNVWVRREDYVSEGVKQCTMMLDGVRQSMLAVDMFR